MTKEELKDWNMIAELNMLNQMYGLQKLQEDQKREGRLRIAKRKALRYDRCKL